MSDQPMVIDEDGNANEWVSSRDAAGIIVITHSHLWKLMDKGFIPFRELENGEREIEMQDLLTFAAAREKAREEMMGKIGTHIVSARLGMEASMELWELYGEDGFDIDILQARPVS